MKYCIMTVVVESKNSQEQPKIEMKYGIIGLW